MYKGIIRLALILASMCLASARGQSFTVGHIRGTNYFAEFKTQYESGNTNAPLLAMDWYSRSDHFCRVSQSGRIVATFNFSGDMRGGYRGPLDAAEKFLLLQAINHLPPSIEKSMPEERQLFVCGIRSNEWFQCVYDRGDVPRDVERLFEIIGTHLEWFIPSVDGRIISQSKNGSYRDSQVTLNSFAVATEVPLAVSTGVNGMQAWDLSGRYDSALLSFPGTPYHAGLWSVATLSPDGNVVVFTSGDGPEENTIYAYNWLTKEMLWEIPNADIGNTYEAGNRVFATGNKGNSLFLAEANRIEHWDMATGTRISTLTTNQSGIRFLQTSRDGTILAAGFGDNTVMVWRTDKDELTGNLALSDRVTSMAVSADGRKIALSNENSRGGFIVWNVETKIQEEFPLRMPYGANSARSMFWSPDGKGLAAEVNSYPSSIVIYRAGTWEPIAQWSFGQIMSPTKFAFRNDGVFLALRDHIIMGLETTKSDTPLENKTVGFALPQQAPAEQKTSYSIGQDLRDFQVRIKATIDPFKLQRIAVPVIACCKPGDTLQEYNMQNAEFFEMARQIRNYTGADIYESKTNTGYVPRALVISCSCETPHHTVGLIIGDKEFAGPEWNKRYVVVPWIKGLYFWERIPRVPSP